MFSRVNKFFMLVSTCVEYFIGIVYSFFFGTSCSQHLKWRKFNSVIREKENSHINLAMFLLVGMKTLLSVIICTVIMYSICHCFYVRTSMYLFKIIIMQNNVCIDTYVQNILRIEYKKGRLIIHVRGVNVFTCLNVSFQNN